MLFIKATTSHQAELNQNIHGVGSVSLPNHTTVLFHTSHLNGRELLY